MKGLHVSELDVVNIVVKVESIRPFGSETTPSVSLVKV
jgi:hypothetical protein